VKCLPTYVCLLGTPSSGLLDFFLTSIYDAGSVHGAILPCRVYLVRDSWNCSCCRRRMSGNRFSRNSGSEFMCCFINIHDSLRGGHVVALWRIVWNIGNCLFNHIHSFSPSIRLFTEDSWGQCKINLLLSMHHNFEACRRVYPKVSRLAA
jgi:hypothetical protein